MRIRRTQMARYLARTVPPPLRALLSLSAQNYLPQFIFNHWLSQVILKDLFFHGIRLYTGPHRLYVPLELLAHYREFEPLTRAYFTNSVKPGMTVIDVGANIGYYTLIAAKAVGATGKVHAIEPCEDTLAFLERNIRLSRLRNTEIHRYAAGPKRGKRMLHVTDCALNNGFYPHPISRTERYIEVIEMPLDELVKSAVHVVKIDVEGAESEVLSGMRSILKENEHLSLFVEWSPACMRNAGHEALDLPCHLQELGLRNIKVLDDWGKWVRPVDEVMEMLRQGQLSQGWYGTLLAQK